ncbi:MAG: ATP-binding protein [Nitrospirae bacterium]|nr:ATP-binding protein [Nitrospirota bacterium]
MRFIGRENELEALIQRYDSGKAELFIMYGRRRIGKSELLLHIANGAKRAKGAKGRRHVYYEASLQDEALNLRDFQHSVVSSLPGDAVLSGVAFHDWHGALTLLAERARTERLLVILDEFPYLCKGNPALPSIIQRFWDNTGRHTKMFLILCGSSVSFMEDEVLGERSPLFGRRTGQLKLEGLRPASVFKFSEGWPVRDRLKTYGIFGNIPAYLNLIEEKTKLADMLTATAFSPTGFLYNEVFFILQQELREPARYNSVLRALAEGKTSIGEIANISGCENTPTAARYLTTLIELGIVEKTAPFFSRAPEKSRNNRYRISDHFIRFWYRFVLPNQTAIRSMSGKAVVKNGVLPFLDDFMGDAFESLCRDFLVYDWLPKSELYIKRIGRHWDRDFDIDICAELGDGSLIMGECKWGEPITYGYLEKLRIRVKSLIADHEVRLALFSGRGLFSKELREASTRGEVMLIGPDELIQEKGNPDLSG